MNYVCKVYDDPFQNLLEAMEQSGEDTGKGVHHVIWDPPYNTRQIAELSNLELNKVDIQNMVHFFEFLSAFTDLGVHDHMFRSAFQLKKWYELLVRKIKEEVKHEEVLECNEPASQRWLLLN